MKPLTDDQRKRLTLYLGECCHDWKWIPGGGLYCTRCPIDLYKKDDIRYEQVMPVPQNRTFTTIQDFYALKCKMVERGEWVEFYSANFWRWVLKTESHSNAKFTEWLFRPESCGLVAEYLEQKEGK